jgi:hypothetical protein
MVFSNRVNHQDMTGAKEVFNRVGYCLSIARYYSCREEINPQPRKSLKSGRNWLLLASGCVPAPGRGTGGQNHSYF